MIEREDIAKKVIRYINEDGKFIQRNPVIKRAVTFHNNVVNNKTQNAMANYLDFFGTDKPLHPANAPKECPYKIEDLDASRKTAFRKGQSLTKDEVMTLFKEISSDAANNRYYVGITCNPEEREDAHNADFLAVVDCPDMDAAKEFEKTAAAYNFDAGKVQANVHKPESKKVYIYKKNPKTKE